MQGDAESILDPPPRRPLWELPAVRTVTVNRVNYRTPRRHVVGGHVVEYPEGVEIVVETDAEIPIRALSPALHVGSVELVENEVTSPTSYRFFVVDEDALRPGDPITLGWVGQPPPKRKSRFRYEPPSDVIDEPPRPR